MYVKLFASIYEGTLRGKAHAQLVFINLLVHANAHGEADIHPQAIADETGLALDDVKHVIDMLETPDPESRSHEESGRRITRLDEHRTWGWRIVNYIKYRGIRNEDDRREYNRLKKAESRLKGKQSADMSMTVNDSQSMSAMSAQAEAEAEALKKEEEGSLGAIPPPSDAPKPCGIGAKAPTPPPPAFMGDANVIELNCKHVVQLASEWELPEQWGMDAEALGWDPVKILLESERFRQYWVSGKGAGTRRSVKGWRQSWSNWMSKAERFAR